VRLKQRRRLGFLIAGIVVFAGCTSSNELSASHVLPRPSQTPSPTPSTTVQASLDVPYVPTPENVVAKMLEMASVKRSDIIYDLGSGDGRIVITAAQKYGASGVGYDLDPKRIKEADENARAAGVTDRVRFVQQDLFKADLSQATVVTLYLLPEVNLKLLPKLLKELKPGTRIVSHNYHFGDWEPIKTETLHSQAGEHFVFYWVVPKAGKKPN
jgi:precorrin-6B methylase 2